MNGWPESDVIFGTLAAQGVGALILAIVVQSFYRHYGKSYLKHWARAWWALVVFAASTGFVRNVALEGVGGEVASVLALGVQGASGYLSAALLSLGFWELTRGRPARERVSRALLIAVAAAGGAVPIMASRFNSLADAERIGAIGQTLLAGAVFVVVAVRAASSPIRIAVSSCDLCVAEVAGDFEGEDGLARVAGEGDVDRDVVPSVHPGVHGELERKGGSAAGGNRPCGEGDRAGAASLAYFRAGFADRDRLVPGVGELPLWADGGVEGNGAELPEPVVDLDGS